MAQSRADNPPHPHGFASAVAQWSLQALSSEKGRTSSSRLSLPAPSLAQC